MTAELAKDCAAAIRDTARAANRAGNSAAAEAYWAAAAVVAEKFGVA